MRTGLAAALIAASGAAQAGGPFVVADDPAVDAPAAAGFDWTGLYAGLSMTNGSFDNGTLDYDT
jgi:outer membrane immunogenic protein